MHKLNTVRNRIQIHAPPDKVFWAVATSEGLNSWFVTDSRVDRKIGGRIELHWRDFGFDKSNIDDDGEIVKYDPNRSFSFTWKPGETRTTVSLVLESIADGSTLLSVSDEGFTAEKDFDALLSCSVGWGEALLALKAYLEFEIVLLDMKRNS
jgi:uncharacterized protein YndB with AHSA1/START domain